MTMKLSKLLFLCSLLVVFGCLNTRSQTRKGSEKNNLLFTDIDISEIFKSYQKDAAKARRKRRTKTGAGILRLNVAQLKGKKEFNVSAHLNNAPLKNVIETILTKTKTQYFLKDVILLGFVSGRFEKIPLLRAVNILLNSQGFSAKFSKEGVLFIRNGVPKKVSKKEKDKKDTPSVNPPGPRGGAPASFSSRVEKVSLHAQVQEEKDAPAQEEAPPSVPRAKPVDDPELTIEYPLHFLSVASASKVLTRLFAPGEGGASGGESGDGASGGALQYGFEETRNTVIIRGSQSKVRKFTRVLQTIDREPQHVLIEVLVLEVDADALEELNFAIKDYANKRYSSLVSSVGAEDALALQFTFENLIKGADGFASNLKFTGLVDLLYRKNLARIIARPYLASLTGKESNLRITEDRSIIVNQVQDGAAVSSTKEISSGVELKITPTVHLSGVITMQVSVEQSDFLSSTGNIATSKDTNKAVTVMQVPDGQSIIIGGLMFNSRSSSNAGLPWLRHIPILNIFTAAQKRTQVDKEVLIVVTPHLYSPGLRTPLPFLEIFQKSTNHNILKTTPTERGDNKQY